MATKGQVAPELKFNPEGDFPDTEALLERAKEFGPSIAEFISDQLDEAKTGLQVAAESLGYLAAGMKEHAMNALKAVDNAMKPANEWVNKHIDEPILTPAMKFLTKPFMERVRKAQDAKREKAQMRQDAKVLKEFFA